ncbi:T9SS type A sorting domain-containing protein [Aquimarina sp. RZ0]|uniref:DUF7619 domain-containing protein n=1 Tax=Aquimarina sp. RZ0 TaxID=2607730 RepID=UPI0011F25D64|nr:T9SS type A sorting domain-containing protein [Aquimarina sp. RZ0]KAA1244898.1 T9SS type A sorting domain-containing protein [Aquimarina sp. RZ0]
MKKITLLGILLCLNLVTYATDIVFTDINFKNALLNHAPAIDTNGDGIINTEEAEEVTRLDLKNSNITDLTEIKYFINLTYLEISNNQLENLDITKNTKLGTLYCNSNKLSTLDLSQNLYLSTLFLFKNKLTSLDISNNTNLYHLQVANNNLSSLDLLNSINLRFLDIQSNPLTTIDVSKNRELTNLTIGNNELVSLDVTQNINLTALTIERNALTSLDISQNIKLKSLSINNTLIESLDVFQNVNLTHLYMINIGLSSLDVTQNSNLTNLYINGSKLSSLDVTQNSNLISLSVNYSLLKQLDVTQNISLRKLGCYSNELINLDVTNNVDLVDLKCYGNQLTKLDVSGNSDLKYLWCGGNQLESLDARNCNLSQVDFTNNPKLTKVYLTDQKFQTTPQLGISFSNCPELKFICVDEEYVAPVQNLFNTPGYTPCDVNNNCDDNYYTISGKITYDLDTNGCDTNDIGFADLKFALSGGSVGFREVFPANSGTYSTAVNQGDYFMFPIFENPTYFNIDPAPSFPPIPISFPADGPIVIKDFCITPNGIYNDLEVLIIPIGVGPRPGFDTGYTIIYKNKGTSTQSGSVTLDYMQDILSLVSSSPNTATTSTNQLSWSFSDLKPLESREITVVFNINKPTDNPAVNDGDILSYTATVTGTTDETPIDNVVPLNQTVRNSYDPNDKICLEGDIIEPTDLDKYLHYMIRFENKGTADAINVIVKDDIDTTTLDIKSFIPLKASHSYTTIINNKKEVEFVFNNINLPFDDANNDGYILFKIKPKPTLIEGDVINNKAAIYFDFNLPVITDVETVTVKKKIIEEPVFTDYFTLSPNPTTGVMSLTPLNSDIAVQHISIHDITGRIVGFFSGDTRDFNVSYLYANTYFMKIHSDKGVLTTTFIKIN